MFKKFYLLIPFIILILSWSVIIYPHQDQQQHYDIIISNGRIVDGSGNPWFYGDIGIRGDRIEKIGHLESAKAAQKIDARGLIVAPGFIDMLGQSEFNLLIDPRAESKVSQGITSEISGEGSSIAPVNEFMLKDQQALLARYNLTGSWQNLAEYFAFLEKQHTAINFGTYVGATQIRRNIIGSQNRPPTAQELREMEKLVTKAMEDGAFGLSSLLIFAPGYYADTSELIALAKVAAQYHGIYATHIRGEADSILEALDEAIRIGREADIAVEIFHLKIGGKNNWGKMDQVIKKIESARESGLDITANQYPYIATATLLSASVPPWAHEGGDKEMIKRLKDPLSREKIKKDANPIFLTKGGGQRILVTNLFNAELKKYQGKRISEIAQMMNQSDEIEALFDLLIADNGETEAIYFSMNEDDVKLAMQQPWVSFCTDYSAVSITGPLSKERTHPRAYGTFPRILGQYVREQRVLRLEEAIRKMSSLPANRLNLIDRGLLKPGFFADIVIFDPAQIRDRSTYEEPNQLSVGVRYTIVNGQIVINDGKQTDKLPGRILRRAGVAGEFKR